MDHEGVSRPSALLTTPLLASLLEYLGTPCSRHRVGYRGSRRCSGCRPPFPTRSRRVGYPGE